MAQKQFTTFQADILSYELRDAMLGIIKPGRYSGFSTMTEQGAQVGAVVTCRFTHGPYTVGKYDKANPPVTTGSHGIVVTRQGIIIDEDGTPDIPVTLVESGTAYHVIVCRHFYVEVQGANNATYDVISGSGGGGIPSVPLTTDAIVGIIKEVNSGGDFDDLTWYPYQPGVGVGDLWNRLFAGPEHFDYDNGNYAAGVPIIGNRLYGGVYLTDSLSLTDALEELDDQAVAEAAARVAIGNRALDNSGWGALTDITQWNVNDLRHGFIPKLPDDNTLFFNGEGDWATPIGKQIVYRGGVYSTDFTKPDFGTFEPYASGIFDVSSIVPVDCDLIWIRVAAYSLNTPATVDFTLGFQRAASDGAASNIELEASGTTAQTRAFETFPVGLTAAKTFRWFSATNTDGDDVFFSIAVTVVAWQTGI